MGPLLVFSLDRFQVQYLYLVQKGLVRVGLRLGFTVMEPFHTYLFVVKCSAGLLPEGAYCNLDSYNWCGWHNVDSTDICAEKDRLDWKWNNGSTPTPHTGPSGDHTTGYGNPFILSHHCPWLRRVEQSQTCFTLLHNLYACPQPATCYPVHVVVSVYFFYFVT